MTYKLSSGRRYLNGELVDPPHLGSWTENDIFPWLDLDDLVDARLFEIAASDDEWNEIEEWLLSIEDSEIPLLFLIERCCDNGVLLPDEMIETRLQDCSQDWISACLSAIKAAPQEFASELFSALSLAVRVERNGRIPSQKIEGEQRAASSGMPRGLGSR